MCRLLADVAHAVRCDSDTALCKSWLELKVFYGSSDFVALSAKLP